MGVLASNDLVNLVAKILYVNSSKKRLLLLGVNHEES